MPSLYATALDCSYTSESVKITPALALSGQDARSHALLTSVAAHVQAETMPDAMRPGFTLLDALLNSSEFFGENPV